MKKVYIEAYLFKNLGDDLFVKILTDRYKNVQFYAQTREYYNKLTFNKNLKIYANLGVGIINKFFEKFFKEYNFIGRKLKNKCDYMVSIGGSIFMEKKDFSKVEKQFSLYDNSKPTYILGANFGPYKTKNYKSYIENILKNMKDVSFRDQKSYQEFNDLKNVRVNSDIVFALDTSKIKIEKNKNVIISVIDCNLKNLSSKKEAYENMILKLINKFVNNGYTVTLMSFCKAQGDEKIINSLYKKCDATTKKYVKKFFYKGDINNTLKEIASSQVVVGSRFHANIIGLLFKKDIIPIAYSDKTINVLKDLEFHGEVIDIRTIEEFDVDRLNINALDSKIDLDKQVKSANNQFSKLDAALNKGDDK